MRLTPTKLADAGVPAHRCRRAAANVAIVRQATTGALWACSNSARRALLDINAAVSEACNNVVVHAYPDADGPMEVELCDRCRPDVEVIVTDHGVGIHPEQAGPGARAPGPRPVPDPDAHRHGSSFSAESATGTTVRMGFSLDGARSPAADDEPRNGDGRVDPPRRERSRSRFRRARWRRRCWAASSRCSQPGSASRSRASARLSSSPTRSPRTRRRASIGEQGPARHRRSDRELVVSVGPLDDGGAERILAFVRQGDLPPVLERLTRERRVETLRGRRAPPPEPRQPRLSGASPQRCPDRRRARGADRAG